MRELSPGIGARGNLIEEYRQSALALIAGVAQKLNPAISRTFDTP